MTQDPNTETLTAQNKLGLNPFNAEATFVQRTMTQRFLITIQTLSCWYSLESSCRVLSDEYPFARVSGFLHHFVLAKLATSSKGAKKILFCFLKTIITSTSIWWVVMTEPNKAEKVTII